MPRGRPAGRPEPTEREMDVMSALWSLGSGTVPEVREALIERHEFEPAYTTVLTQLRALEKKGWVRATLEGKAHRYVPLVDIAQAKRHAIAHLVDSLYDGSRELLLAELVSDPRLRQATIARLRRLLEARAR